MAAGLRRLGALTYKETMQLLRDRRTLMYFFLLPAIQLFLFAYAVSLTVYHLPTVLVDQSLDTRSRDFVHALVSSTYFDIVSEAENEQQAIDAINAGQAKAGIVIPPNLESDVQRGDGNVLILLDGSDSFSVSSGYSAAFIIAQNYSFNLEAQAISKLGSATQSLGANSQPVVTETRVLYNPGIQDLVFILPGLIALIMQIIIVAHSAVAVVRERELGTLEQLLSTPMRPLEMIIAKLIPGLVVVMIDLAFVLVLGVYWFRVPFKGDILLFAGLSVLFVISGMGMGLFISTFAKNQRQAQQFSAVLNMFSMLLTGFIYPRMTMPVWAQAIGDLIPLTYYIRIIRGIITKGVGINFLWTDALALGVYSLVAIGISAIIAKKRLD
jgi:ABC-2 type transport system permease protein